jgi:hypothetical protein
MSNTSGQGTSMSQSEIAQLLELVRQAIHQAEDSTENRNGRLFQRVVAYLWLAHDELELVSEQQVARGDRSR